MSFKSLLDKIIYHINYTKLNIFNTIYINFRVLPFSQARKLPIYIYSKADIYWLKGKILFENTEIKRGMVKLGRNTELFCGVSQSSLIILNQDSKLIFEGPCSIGNNFVLRISSGAELRLGKYTFFGGSVKIICTKKIHIKRYSRIAFESQIIDSNFHFMINTKDNSINRKGDEITLGEFNWIGNRTSITKGTKTKDFTIVSSGSILNKDYTKSENENIILAGAPAKEVASGFKRIFSLEIEKQLDKYFECNNNVKYIYPGEFVDDYSDLNNKFI